MQAKTVQNVLPVTLVSQTTEKNEQMPEDKTTV